MNIPVPSFLIIIISCNFKYPLIRALESRCNDIATYSRRCLCGCDRGIASKKKKRLVVKSTLHCDFITVPISPLNGKILRSLVGSVSAKIYVMRIRLHIEYVWHNIHSLFFFSKHQRSLRY